MSTAANAVLDRGLLHWLGAAAPVAADAPAEQMPRYTVDTSWPKLPPPNKWTFGEMGGMFVDASDHVWVVQRPGTLFLWERPPRSIRRRGVAVCRRRRSWSSIQQGNLVQAWGGTGKGYEWPTTEHGHPGRSQRLCLGRRQFDATGAQG